MSESGVLVALDRTFLAMAGPGVGQGQLVCGDKKSGSWGAGGGPSVGAGVPADWKWRGRGARPACR